VSIGDSGREPEGAFTRGDPAEEILVGISTCLLGEEVRFDGGHKRDSFLADVLGRFVRFVPSCPEVEIGMGTPREAVRLIRLDGRARMRGVRTDTDHTDAMEEYARRRVRELEAMGLCGYVLKRSSPSCGMERVREYDAAGHAARTGTGIFARILMEELPLLPVEEEGRLNDDRLRESFIERIFAYRRLRNLFRPGWTVGDLVRFHTAEKLQLLAHDPETYRRLGRRVAEAADADREELRRDYSARFMDGYARHTSTGKNLNVLQHMFGYLRDRLSPAERDGVLATLSDYAEGWVPLVVPVTLIRHYVRVHGIEYLEGQHYLQPHPKELLLRNHV
jgi:uncharacterized protein YbgA (DUF1722 family)/uncharacterized protein YbbK (DUF523 family)